MFLDVCFFDLKIIFILLHFTSDKILFGRSSTREAYTKLIILSIKSPFTCGERNLPKNRVDCQNIIVTIIVLIPCDIMNLILDLKNCVEKVLETF